MIKTTYKYTKDKNHVWNQYTYLIRHASFILSAGLHLYSRVQTSEHCWKKNNGSLRTRTNDLWITSIMGSQLS